jgi:hypothetical protein
MGVLCRMANSFAGASLPADARWNAERQAVEFGVEIGAYETAQVTPKPRLRVTYAIALHRGHYRPWPRENSNV